MNLKVELEKYKAASIAKKTKEDADKMENDFKEKAKANITKNALKVGDKIPSFKLGNAIGHQVSSEELLANGPLIISFYRGAWCPYCNLELAAYQEVLDEIIDAGGQLVAISPELPDSSMSLIEKHSLGYEILSDLNNELAHAFGLVFHVADDIVALYKTMGIDLEKSQGNSNAELPFPATYVVNTDGTIVEAAVTYDYRVRLEPEDAIESLKSCVY